MRSVAVVAVAAMAVATAVQAQAAWVSQRFTEAGFTAETPSALSSAGEKTGQESGDNYIQRTYQASHGGLVYLVVSSDMSTVSIARQTPAQEFVSNMMAGALGEMTNISRMNSPGAGQEEAMASINGARVRMRFSFRYPWAMAAIVMTSEENAAALTSPEANRFLDGVRILP